jgi:hypothetical protein
LRPERKILPDQERRPLPSGDSVPVRRRAGTALFTRSRTRILVLFSAVLLFAAPLLPETVRIANQYVAVDFDTISGRYMIRTTSGDPDIPSDDNQVMTGDFLNSSAVIKLDNQYYRFGDMSGKTVSSAAKGDIATFVWNLKGMEITQEVRLTNSIFSPVASFVKVRYWLKNTDNTYHYAGLRVIFDTMLGANDDDPILNPLSGIIDKEKEFSFDGVPDYWCAWDAISSPASRPLMSFAERNVVKPDYLTFASRKRLGETKWDFKTDPFLDFRSYAMEPPDTAVSMKWETIPFKPGYGNGAAFFYGTAKAFANDKMPPLDLVGLAPSRTERQNFWIQAEVKNSGPLKTVKNLKLKIELPPGLALTQGSLEQSFPEVKPNEKRDAFWNVTVQRKGGYTVKVTAVGTAGSTVINQVSLPMSCE